MKLSRNTLRSLAVGVLASAVVTAAFALSQGQLPVQGVNGTNVLNGGTTTVNADQQARLDALSSEKSALESTQNTLNASLASLKEQASRQSSELEALKSHSTSSSSASNESSSTSSEGSSSSSNEASQADTTEASQEETHNAGTTGTTAPSDGQWTTEGGNFTVNPGDTSEDVAQNLYDAGIISSPDVFLEVVDQWDLSTLLIAGTYELNSGMNVNTIAEILTNGAYYWQP